MFELIKETVKTNNESLMAGLELGRMESENRITVLERKKLLLEETIKDMYKILEEL